MDRINLIGISGKKRHGKNTIAFIIQHQIARANGNETLSHPLKEDEESLQRKSKWVQKSFANKLKRIASILTGIPTKDFEKEDVKNHLMPKEWDKPNEVMTYRGFLQKLGTEAMRDTLHPNIWVNALFSTFKDNRIGYVATPFTPVAEVEIGDEDNWIITDVRFPNEFEAIKERGGLNIRVFRPGQLKVWYNDKINSDEEDHSGYYYVQAIDGDNYSISSDKEGKESLLSVSRYEVLLDHVDNHPSEIALDNYKFDEVIINNRDIEDLNEKVKSILIKHKII